MNETESKNAIFSNEVENLYRLHYVTKKYEHYIRVNPETLKLFEATKFVYAYFAFNSFYNYDWERSLTEHKLCDFEKDVDEEGIEKEKSENYRYKALSDFVISRMDDEDNDIFFRTIIGQHYHDYERKVSEILNHIEQITEDNRITESKREHFKTYFEKMLRDREIKKGHFKNDILYFVVMVRNNIFHGTKDTIQMSEVRQRKRLEIYTNILIAVNEMLFRILAREKVFIPQHIYHLNIK